MTQEFAGKISRRGFTLAAASAPIFMTGAQAAPAAAPPTRRPAATPDAVTAEMPGPVRAFALPQVTLNDGPFRDALRWDMAFMKRLSPDRLLHTFRLNADLPSNAQPLSGWEAPDCELRGHFTGHYLSASALLYSATGDSEIKERADYIVGALGQCQKKLAAGGYLSAFPLTFFDRLDKRENVWAPFYTLHKIMAGLLDMYRLTGNRAALDVLIGMATWTDAWTAARTPEHMQDILTTEYGGMNEVLYNLAAATDDRRWVGVGDRFNKAVFFDPLSTRKDQLKGLHMNTHVPQVIGAVQRYNLTGENKYREIANFFWETVSSARTYTTGGSSNREHWLTEPYRLGAEWSMGVDHQECCCAYNMMKLTRHLFGWAPDEKYIAYYERNLFNHRLGAIEPQTGNTIYFLSMAPGAWKSPSTDDASFWCCNGTGVEEFAKLADTIYYHDGSGVYVNLYIASTLDWPERAIRLEQHTKFPDEAKTTLVVRAAPGGKWPIHLRIPGWTHGAQVSVNGRPLEAVADPGSYLQIAREWRRGDRIELDMPMRLHSEGFTDVANVQALLYGPIVLAGQFPKGGLPETVQHEQGPALDKFPIDVPKLATGGKPLESIVKPVPGARLTYTTVGQTADIVLKPLNQSWDRFAVYWRTV
ncbi:MAG: glycoside hydrolase family 127 protein [Alphaproteobacteria bacterium]|nr:glycoside hydrolase family 127 protein [Alphaproteobacteria bacterium]MDE2112392.1 glycoside hydrolase family 127 protein [Alphaproteobacteria bacterium]MDE2495317.1 glycoside hydrolase family 127 protein [Alphaproteobacteria bacterium]